MNRPHSPALSPLGLDAVPRKPLSTGRRCQEAILRLGAVCGGLTLLLGLAPALPGQTLPSPSDKDRAVVRAIVDACVKAGGLRESKGPGGTTRLEVANADKLAAALHGRKDLTAAVRAALFRLAFEQKDAVAQASLATVLAAVGALDKDRRTQALAVVLQADALDRQNQHRQALASAKRAVLLLAPLDEPAWKAYCLKLAATQHKWIGEYRQAAPLYRDALALYRRTPPLFRTTTFDILSDLGFVSRMQNDFKEAVRWYRPALVEARRLYPAARFKDGHPRLASTINDLAGCLYYGGQRAAGIALFEEALAMQRKLSPKKTFPRGSPKLAFALKNLGIVLHNEGRFERSADLLGEWVEMKLGSGDWEEKEFQDSLGFLVEMLLGRGDVVKALGHLRRAEEAYGKRFPGLHPGTAIVVRLTGLAHQAGRDYPCALDCYRRTLALREKLYPAARHPRGHALLAQSLIDVGLVLDRLRRPRESLPYHLKGLEMNRRLYPQGHIDVAVSYNNVGVARLALGQVEAGMRDLRTAVAMYEKLFPRREFPSGHPDLTLALYNLGRAHKLRGEMNEALACYRRASAGGDVLVGRYSPNRLTVLGMLADLLREQGQAAEALEVDKRRLAIFRTLYPASRYPDGHPSLADFLGAMGLTYNASGETATALRYFQQGLLMLEHLVQVPAYRQKALGFLPVLRNGLGTVYLTRREHAPARASLLRALKDLAALPDQDTSNTTLDRAVILSNLSLAYQGLGQLDQSQECLEENAALLQKLYPKTSHPDGHPALATNLINRGYLMYLRRRFEQTEELYTRALAMNRKLYPASAYPLGHPELSLNLKNLAYVKELLGRRRAALPLYDEAIQSLRLTADPVNLDGGVSAAPALRLLIDTVSTLNLRARAMLRLLPADATVEQLRACDRAFALAAEVLDRLRSRSMQMDDSKLLINARFSASTPLRLGLLARLATVRGRPEALHTAFTALEEGRARVLLDALSRTNAGRLAGLPAEEQEKERHFVAALRDVESRIEAARLRSASREQRLRELFQQREKLQQGQADFVARLAQTHPTYAGLRYPRACTLAEARASLSDREVAVLFAVEDEEAFALIVHKKPAPGDRSGGVALVKLPGADVLGPKVRTLVDTEVLKSDSRCRRLGAELYALLLKPLEKHLRGKDLVLAPDDVLWELPFELLVEGRTAESDGRYLIESRQVRYTPSLSVLHLIGAWEKKRKVPAEPLWALGDPIFSKDDARSRGDLHQQTRDLLVLYARRLRGGRSWARLPATGAEVRAIAALHRAAPEDVVTGALASERVIKTASATGVLARKRYVHLATHGILGSGRGKPPSLVLSLLDNDGKEQLGGVNDGFLTVNEVAQLQLNADLVVLSACQTGKGDLRLAEGVIGLSRAFLYAGSRGVVCSLWTVEDEQTSRLMQTMYTELKKGKSSAEALTLARRQLIVEERAPFYWAPFILIGK